MATFDEEKFLAAYNQNSEHFRSLNGLMWQIPLIAMTLTGGLWFGVSKVEANKLFQLCLLGLAAIGNIGLLVALSRLRYIMGQYLSWFETNYPAGHVTALGNGSWLTAKQIVQRTFQTLLGLAAAISFILFGVTCKSMFSTPTSLSSIAYYDRHAAELADGYEAIDFEQAHPDLALFLKPGTPPMRILDVGAGTGRDAAWFAARGHLVTAVEPSAKMRQLAGRLHPSDRVKWIDGSLPDLKGLADGQFDLVVLSAVWMHVPPDQREQAMKRLVQMLAPGASLYVTLRVGPTDKARSIYSVSFQELAALAKRLNVDAKLVGESPDLLARSNIKWERVLITKPAAQR